MKIEKLTENKIRIIANSSDLGFKGADIHLIMSTALEEQKFFLDILNKAKKEVGFNTDGCRLLIEAFSSIDDVLVFTITKYSKENIKVSPKKRLSAKRKGLDSFDKHAIFCFNDFDEFCEFCEYINNHFHFDIRHVSNNVCLYLYDNTYYLIVKNIDVSSKATQAFYCVLSEFVAPVHFSNSFESKLVEHGKVIMRKNAITTGIKYFCH